MGTMFSGQTVSSFAPGTFGFKDRHTDSLHSSSVLQAPGASTTKSLTVGVKSVQECVEK